MKKAKLFLAVASLAIISLIAISCAQSNAEQDEQEGVTQEESQQIAREYLLKSPTYVFDGVEGSVELVDTVTARCPQCWIFEYEFESRHAGYGDRTGQMLAQVITPHTAKITVEQGEVKRAVLDEKWNMMTQNHIFTEEASREMAENLVRTSPTFVFDGMEETLTLVETLYPDIEGAWQFVYEFESRHAGYGDRTGQMLAQVITSHQAIVTVEKGQILNAIMDEKWDMLEQKELGNGDGLIGGTPASCGYAWDGERGGWHRPWDENSFIPADEKPEWKRFIPCGEDIGDLKDREWVLVSLGDIHNPRPVLEDTRITMSFSEEGTDATLIVQGSAGCNSYSGAFEITEERIVVGPVMATEMACLQPDGVMAQETEFLSALGNASAYQVDEGMLEIYYQGGVLIFTAE
ncbi:MAG: META domain-containing protein [Dehalococcoidia bacterium]